MVGAARFNGGARIDVIGRASMCAEPIEINKETRVC